MWYFISLRNSRQIFFGRLKIAISYFQPLQMCWKWTRRKNYRNHVKHFGLVLINLFVNLLNYEKKKGEDKKRLENLKFTIIIFVNFHLPTCDHFNLSTIPKISNRSCDQERIYTFNYYEKKEKKNRMTKRNLNVMNILKSMPDNSLNCFKLDHKSWNYDD